jgi:hypothetical protein
MFLSDVVPPTAPVNVVLPLPAATVIDSVLAVVPLTVELNVTAESVVVNVVLPSNSTTPLYVWVVEVVTPPLNLAVPVAFVVNDPVTDKLCALAAAPMKKPPVLFKVVLVPKVDVPDATV